MPAEKTAVVVLDMQEDVVRGPWFTWSPPADQIVKSCGELVAAARQAKVPVLYTAVEYRRDGSNTPLAIATGEPTPFEFLNEGTPGVAIIPELRPEPGELVATKNLISAFDATGFADAVEAGGFRTLVLVGIQLEYAVLTTANDARSRGLDVVVVSDCCGASNETAYNDHVENVLPPLGTVVSLQEALALLSGQRSARMTTTKMIDVDPRVLRDAAQAALHAAQQSWTHLQSELDFEQSGDVETVMATLVENGPYSFTSSGGEEGSRFEATVAQANKPGVASTREAVFKHYTKVHGSFVIEAFQPMIEIRGSWYTFFESLTTLGIKGTTDSAQMVNLVLMASGTGRGITGEISAAVDPAAARAAASSAGVSFESFRQQRVAQLDEVLAALLGADTEALVKLLGEDAQSLIRDYVDDTGALVNLDGGDAHRAHYDALFEKYRFERADVLHRVSQEVYLFAETRLTAAPRAGDGAPIAFHIAEWYTTAPDGGLVRMGHGSDVG